MANIHLDVHRSLLKGLSSGETIVLYCLWLRGDRSSPWLNELRTQFVYVLYLSSSHLRFTTANFYHGIKAVLSHCQKLGLDILRPPLTDPGEKVTWKLCPREGASIDEGTIQL